MNLKTFLEHFDTIAEAPGGIQKLRSLILDLAVRGKLVPQNPEDEPAEKLLKVIFNKHIAFGKKFRKPKDLPPIENIDKPFELPYGWCWCRFTEIGQLERGRSKHRPRNEPALYKDGSIPLVQTGDVARANGLITTYTALYNEKGLAQSRLWSKGTLCITIAANIADSAILGFDACFPDSIVGFLPTEPISDSRYFEFFIRTLKSHLEDFAPSTAQKNINLAILDEVLIPLPPLAEQKRIVEKVDELMGLCDRLSSAKQTRDNLRQKLRESAIASLMNAETDEELEKGWAIVRDNWCEVSQCSEDVSSLRKSVLQLAIKGKLVPQHFHDEAASELIEKVRVEKAQLVKEKNIPKPTKIEPIKGSIFPYEISKTWSWIRLGEISKFIEYGTSEKASDIQDDVPVFRMNNIQNGKLIFNKLKYVSASIRDLPKLYLQDGDLLFNRTNSYELVGKTGLFRGENNQYTFASYLIRITLFLEYINPEFINLVINSPYFRQSQIEPEIVQQCGQANFNGTKLQNTLIPLPPLAEQKRIVAKVDELMKLCDQLEASLRQSQQRAESLAASAISHLTL